MLFFQKYFLQCENKYPDCIFFFQQPYMEQLMQCPEMLNTTDDTIQLINVF